jgi:hypothetical protein
MKFNVYCILRDQWRTIGGTRAAWVSDIAFFLVIPLILSILVVRGEVEYTNEVYGYALAVYSIFSALLITAQIAAYGMFQKHAERKWDYERLPQERKSIGAEREVRVGERRKENLKELNANISYLTLLSCAAASILLGFIAFSMSDTFETFIATFLYSHFAVCLAMVLKRFHIVFEDEYLER